MRPKQEHAGSITRPPERPVRVLRVLRCALHRRAALTPALLCRAALSLIAATNGTGPAADAAPGTPPAHAGAPSTVPGTVPRGISGYRATWGPAPASGCVASRAGGRPTVPRALEVLGSEGTQHTLAVLRDLMQYSQYREYPEHPMRTTHRDVSWQRYCPM